jgi:hypothetical protein
MNFVDIMGLYMLHVCTATGNVVTGSNRGGGPWTGIRVAGDEVVGTGASKIDQAEAAKAALKNYYKNASDKRAMKLKSVKPGETVRVDKPVVKCSVVDMCGPPEEEESEDPEFPELPPIKPPVLG